MLPLRDLGMQLAPELGAIGRQRRQRAALIGRTGLLQTVDGCGGGEDHRYSPLASGVEDADRAAEVGGMRGRPRLVQACADAIAARWKQPSTPCIARTTCG